MATRFYGLTDDFSDGKTTYRGEEIARLHRIVSEQVTGALDVLGTGVVRSNGNTYFAVTAGTGLSVNIAAGLAVAQHLTLGSCVLQTTATIARAIPANVTRFLFATIDNNVSNDSRVTRAPAFLLSDIEILDGAVLLAKIVTGASSVSGVTDRRKRLSLGDDRGASADANQSANLVKAGPASGAAAAPAYRALTGADLPSATTTEKGGMIFASDGNATPGRAVMADDSRLLGTGGSTTLRNGVGAPSSTLGTNSDYYLDTSSGDLFKKASGAYSLQGNLRGPLGPSGASGDAGINGGVWRDGAGVPNNAVGANGDYYLNTVSGDVYTRAASVYELRANIKGVAGAAGGVLGGSYPNPVFAVDMATQAELDQHTANTSNPHSVTKAQVGLGNVDDTSDANKGISAATQNALNLKAIDSDVVHRTGNESIADNKIFTASPVVPAPIGMNYAVNRGYLETYVGQQVSSVSGRTGAGVQNLTELSALPANERVDRQIRLVEDEGATFRFDAESLAAPQTNRVVLPGDLAVSSAGRWLKTSAETQDHSQLVGLQGGTSTERYHLTSAEKGRVPSSDVSAALTGTGTPSANNKFVTSNDSRVVGAALTNAANAFTFDQAIEGVGGRISSATTGAPRWGFFDALVNGTRAFLSQIVAGVDNSINLDAVKIRARSVADDDSSTYFFASPTGTNLRGPLTVDGVAVSGTALARTQVAFTSNSLGAGASQNVRAVFGKAGQLFSLRASQPCWVRIYSSDAARIADAGRVMGTDAALDAGVMGEMIFNAVNQTIFPPLPANYFQNETTNLGQMPFTIKNLGSAGTINLTFSVLILEN